jgi:tryptophanyl-tRNA synthetase
MYTDPNRLTGKEPGEVDPAKNPLWALLDAFVTDRDWYEEQSALYAHGRVGDVALKRKLIDILEAFLGPIRQRRRYYDAHEDAVFSAMADGTVRANAITEKTLAEMKRAMRQDFFHRTVVISSR